MAARTASLLAVLLLAFVALTGCKKDEFVVQTLDEAGALATAISTEIENAPDKAAGVAAAQKKLDDQKADLKPKLAELASLRGYQVSDETKTKMAADLMKHVGTVEGLRLKLMADTRKDPALDAALKTLLADYRGLVLGK